MKVFGKDDGWEDVTGECKVRDDGTLVHVEEETVRKETVVMGPLYRTSVKTRTASDTDADGNPVMRKYTGIVVEKREED